MERDSSDDDPDEEEVGLLGAIGRIVEALADAEREGRTEVGGAGRHPSGHFTTEYGYAGRIGLDDLDSGSGSGSGRASASGSQPDTGESPATDDAYRVDVRYDESADELLVVADLPDVNADDLDAAVDRASNELLIDVEDRTVERLELPWPVDDVDSRFRHGILELRFTPSDDPE